MKLVKVNGRLFGMILFLESVLIFMGKFEKNYLPVSDNLSKTIYPSISPMISTRPQLSAAGKNQDTRFFIFLKSSW